jgi:putative peptidoglycan lipid II flippase
MSLLRTTSWIALGTVASRATGLIEALVLAAAIGTVRSVGADAYATATIVPASIYALIGGGLFTSFLVPQIVRASQAADAGRAYVNKLLTIAAIGFAAVALAATALSPLLMYLYGQRGGALVLACGLALWSFPQVFFLGLSAVLGEVLNARRFFGWSTWAPVANNVIGISGLLLFVLYFGASGYRVASDYSTAAIVLLGASGLAGVAAQVVVLVFGWRSNGLSFRPDFRWRGVGLASTGRTAGWTIAMLAATQLAGLLQTAVANGAAGVGPSTGALGYAWLIFMLPHSLVTVSLLTVYYPRLSTAAAERDIEQVHSLLGQTIRAVLPLIVLADVSLIVAAEPIARLLTHGPQDARALSLIIVGYLIGLVPFTLLAVVQRCFYALGDSRTPFSYTLVQVVLVSAGFLACMFLPIGFRALGIALVTTIGGLVQSAIAWRLFRRRTGRAPLGLSRTAKSTSAAALSALVLGVAALLLANSVFGADVVTANWLTAIVTTVVLTVISAGAYVLGLRLTYSTELTAALQRLSRRPQATKAGT